MMDVDIVGVILALVFIGWIVGVVYLLLLVARGLLKGAIKDAIKEWRMRSGADTSPVHYPSLVTFEPKPSISTLNSQLSTRAGQ